MATEVNFNKDDENEENQLSGGADASQGGASASPQAGAGGATAAAGPAAARPSSPGGRPNIRQYLEANQGAGQNLASGIQNKTQAKAGEIEKGIAEGRNQLQAATNPLEQKLGEQGQQVVKTAFRDPASLLKQQDQLSEFQKLRSGGYGQDISGVNQQAQQQQQALQGQVNQLGQTADLAGSEGGRFELLRNTYGQPTYTRGQQRLDQLFLQAQPGAAKNLQSGLQGIQQGQAQNLSGLSSEAQAKINALSGLAGQRADEWQKLYSGGAGEGLDTNLQDRGLADIDASSQKRLADAQGQIEYASGARDRLGKNALTSQDISNLGLSDLTGKTLYDINLGNYMNQTDKEATLAGTADQAEVARYRALKQLSGDTSGDLFGGAAGDQIGGFKAYDFNKDKLAQDLTSTQKRFEQDNVNNIINQMRSGNYFGGRSEGGGMRAADPTSGNRTATGALLSQVQAGAGQGDPNDYYSQVQNAINQGWGNVYGANAFNQLAGSTYGGLYSQLGNYGKELNKQRGNILGQTSLPTVAGAANPNEVDWDAISNQLAQNGYKLPTNKGAAAPRDLEDSDFFNVKK